MASIRRTLSPVPRPGGLINGEASQVASPLSKSSSNSQNSPVHGGPLSSSLGPLDYAFYKAQNLFLGLFSQRSSQPSDRPKLKGQIWQRAYLHFITCFIIGMLVGITPFMNLSANIMPKHEAFDLELLQPFGEQELYIGRISLNENSIFEPEKFNIGLNNPPLDHSVLNKLLIIVTPTYARPLQAYYLTRLAQTLKLIPHPLLWIVVEMNYQSNEIADLLRKTGVMYRHLVGSAKNGTEITDSSALLRNVALSHIETHRLDGIVYFADDDKMYSTGLFDQMRNISRIGTWMVAKLVESTGEIILEGPLCNSSQVIGWHLVDSEKRSRRFHAEMLGFAFNSTIIWDPKRWHRPMIEPIRQLEMVKEDMQASAFIEQLVEDASQMECFSMNSSGIMVWYHTSGSFSNPHNWFSSNIFGTFAALE